MMDDQSGNSGNLFKKVFKQYIEKKIEQEYENYFKNILKEATENVNNDQANMREVVGIKVGLEYIRQQQQERERNIIEKKELFRRKQESKVYRYAYELQNNNIFNFFMVACIIVNTLILSLDKYPVNLKE